MSLINDFTITLGYSLCVILIVLSIKKLKTLLNNTELAGGVGMNWQAAFLHLAVVLTFFLTQIVQEITTYSTNWS